jgi:hypothetical protein
MTGLDRWSRLEVTPIAYHVPSARHVGKMLIRNG